MFSMNDKSGLSRKMVKRFLYSVQYRVNNLNPVPIYIASRERLPVLLDKHETRGLIVAQDYH